MREHERDESEESRTLFEVRELLEYLRAKIDRNDYTYRECERIVESFEARIDRIGARLQQIEHAVASLANSAQHLEPCRDCNGLGTENAGSLGVMTCETCNGSGRKPQLQRHPQSPIARMLEKTGNPIP